MASTGDSGSPGEYPAYSPYVVAAGGTTLYTSAGGVYQSESAWSGSGGGMSVYEPEPVYQTAVQIDGQADDSRTLPLTPTPAPACGLRHV